MTEKQEFPGAHVMQGEELDVRYVQSYVDSHARVDPAYLANYSEYLLVDRLFDHPYTACVTGCGTLGQAQLLSRARDVLGVDLSDKMIAAGQALNRGKRPPVRYVKEDVRIFPSHCTETFDFIEVGLQGSYLPLDPKLLAAYFAKLNPGGVLLIICAVIRAADLVGQEDSLWKSLYLSLLRIFHDVRSAMSSRIPITLTQANRRINAFVKGQTNAQILLKSLTTRSDPRFSSYVAYIRKTG